MIIIEKFFSYQQQFFNQQNRTLIITNNKINSFFKITIRIATEIKISVNDYFDQWFHVIKNYVANLKNTFIAVQINKANLKHFETKIHALTQHLTNQQFELNNTFFALQEILNHVDQYKSQTTEIVNKKTIQEKQEKSEYSNQDFQNRNLEVATCSTFTWFEIRKRRFKFEKKKKIKIDFSTKKKRFSEFSKSFILIDEKNLFYEN